MKNQKQSLTPAKVLSARKFVFNGRYFMEELHGCVRHERSAFLSCFSSRPSQPSWTSASPVGHPRFSVLRPAVRRQEPRGNRSSARGSFDGLQKAVHLLSLLAHESGLTLAQMVVPNGGEEKTNEHKAALRLLEGLVLEGRLVTGDAMFCHRDFCQQVIDARGDYLVFVKDNQPTLLNDIRMAFAPPA